jgi:hypothetical protein
MANSTEVIRTARTLNPGIRVLARASYLRDVPSLKEAGANSVYSGEGEVALAFIEDILDSLGATPEQIDRERARAHGELSEKCDDLLRKLPFARLERHHTEPVIARVPKPVAVCVHARGKALKPGGDAVERAATD